MKKLRLLLITLCVSVLMGSMAVTAYAGGGEEWDGLAPVEPLPAAVTFVGTPQRSSQPNTRLLPPQK